MFGDFQKNSYAERNMRFGVREHAMGAIANGERPCAPCFAAAAARVACSRLYTCEYCTQPPRFQLTLMPRAPPPPSAGISLHSPGFVPYCATFFIFSDYMRNPMRMAALSEVRAGAWWCCAWWPWVAQYVCAVPDQ